MSENQTYFSQRMQLYGITPEINRIGILKYNAETRQNELQDVPIFRESERGIDIYVYTLDRSLIMHEKLGGRWKTQEYHITRLSEPVTDAKGNTRKYDIPKGAGTHPFFPPALVEKYERGETIDTLILTEGYFKAFKASMHGFDIVGLSSITHYMDKESKTIHSDIAKLLTKCHVRRIVWLVDGDCLDLSSKAFAEGEKEPVDLYKRPNQFFASANGIRRLLEPYGEERVFCHLISSAHPAQPKALDDLLIEMKGQETLVLNDFLVSGRPSQYFHKIDMTYGPSKIHSYFHIKNADDFYNFYVERYPQLAKHEFVFNGTKYIHDGEKNECRIVVPGDAKNYFRVGDQYHEKIDIPNKYGDTEKTFHRRQKSTIVDDYGKKFVEHIPKYKAFCVVPDHQNFQQIQNSCYNLYAPFEHEPDEGECPKTLKFLKHIFGTSDITRRLEKTKQNFTINEMELGLDYVQLLYQKPTQTLPILCLVSSEQGTGKTTFAKWLRMIFTQNVAIVGNAELADNFNASWASKLLIICDEAKIDKQIVVEKVKSLSTADKIFMNAKGKDHVEIDFFGKFLFMTNNEDNFIYANDNDVRYWIRKVPVIKDLDTDLLRDLREEIPFFLSFLNKRQMATEEMHRAWFDPALIKTEALKKVIEFSQSTISREIKTAIRDMFMDFPDLTEIHMTKKAIKEEFLRHKAVEMNYLQRVLENELRVEMVHRYEHDGKIYLTQEAFREAHPELNPLEYKKMLVQRSEYPRWETVHKDGKPEKIRVQVQDHGRPYVFKIERFLLPDEIRNRVNIDHLNISAPKADGDELPF